MNRCHVHRANILNCSILIQWSRGWSSHYEYCRLLTGSIHYFGRKWTSSHLVMFIMSNCPELSPLQWHFPCSSVKCFVLSASRASWVMDFYNAWNTPAISCKSIDGLTLQLNWRIVVMHNVRRYSLFGWYLGVPHTQYLNWDALCGDPSWCAFALHDLPQYVLFFNARTWEGTVRHTRKDLRGWGPARTKSNVPVSNVGKVLACLYALAIHTWSLLFAGRLSDVNF